MEQSKIENFKNRLIEERELIEEGLSSFAHKDSKSKGGWESNFPSFGEHTSEQDENADETQEYLNELSTEQALENRLHSINLALEKIEEGEGSTYGICESCGKPIEDERLEAEPSARTHVSCK